MTRDPGGGGGGGWVGWKPKMGQSRWMKALFRINSWQETGMSKSRAIFPSNSQDSGQLIQWLETKILLLRAISLQVQILCDPITSQRPCYLLMFHWDQCLSSHHVVTGSSGTLGRQPPLNLPNRKVGLRMRPALQLVIA